MEPLALVLESTAPNRGLGGGGTILRTNDRQKCPGSYLSSWQTALHMPNNICLRQTRHDRGNYVERDWSEKTPRFSGLSANIFREDSRHNKRRLAFRIEVSRFSLQKQQRAIKLMVSHCPAQQSEWPSLSASMLAPKRIQADQRGHPSQEVLVFRRCLRHDSWSSIRYYRDTSGNCILHIGMGFTPMNHGHTSDRFRAHSRCRSRHWR